MSSWSTLEAAKEGEDMKMLKKFRVFTVFKGSQRGQGVHEKPERSEKSEI